MLARRVSGYRAGSGTLIVGAVVALATVLSNESWSGAALTPFVVSTRAASPRAVSRARLTRGRAFLLVSDGLVPRIARWQSGRPRSVRSASNAVDPRLLNRPSRVY